jgi:hypothetical protein
VSEGRKREREREGGREQGFKRLILSSNLKRHLEQQHPDALQGYVFNTETSRTLLSRSFATSGIPLAFIDNPDFRAFIQSLNPNFALPGKTTLRFQLLVELRHQLVGVMKEKIQQIDQFGLTVDSWTSMAQRQFLAVTAHGITDTWSMESFVLGLIPVIGQETGESVAKDVLHLLPTWGIKEDQILAVTTDGASNMKNFVATQLCRPWIYCAAHALNLVVRKGMSVAAILLLTIHGSFW